ncbi:MAG: sulfatase/phosphatase domain-containing protein, partial [Candidatus Brocadiia bacterium]
DLYEGGIRVPTLAWWPGTIPGGRTSGHISAFWDFLPTACEAAGIDAPQGIDGISFLPTLQGKPEQQKPHDDLYWAFPGHGGKQALRKGKWKAVRLNTRKKPQGPVELYDLEADIGETTDLADKHPDIARALAKLMDEAHIEGGKSG